MFDLIFAKVYITIDNALSTGGEVYQVCRRSKEHARQISLCARLLGPSGGKLPMKIFE